MEIAASAQSISKRSDDSRVRTASSQHAPSLYCIDLPAAVLGLRHQPDTTLAVMAGHRGEFVKDTAPFLLGKRLAAIPYCCQQRLFHHSAYAFRQAIASQFFGSILLSQCVYRC